MKNAVKVLFEQAKADGIRSMNIDPGLLTEVVPQMVADYLSEGNLQMAYEAAKVNRNPADFRAIYKVMNKKKKVVRDLLIEVMMAGEMRKELREVVKKMIETGGEELTSDVLLKICVYLEDGSSLVVAAKLAIQYFWDLLEAERKTKVLLSSTMSQPRIIMNMLEKAKNLSARQAISVICWRFGNDLHARFGFEHSTLAIRAWHLAGTKSSLLKAAEGYEIDNDFEDAAACYLELGDYGRVKEMIRQIAREGQLSRAVRTHVRLFPKALIHADSLSELVAETVSAAREKVVLRIGDYLNEHDTDSPFPTECTFWHGSDTNTEWADYLQVVYALSGRHDMPFDRRGRQPIAREIYCTDNSALMSCIHYTLKKHLLVGYMLSALAMEVDRSCLRSGRKYKHSFDAAWRTFTYAVDGRGDNPFGDEGCVGLRNDLDIKTLNACLKAFRTRIEAHKVLKHGFHEHVRASDSFLREHSPEVMDVVRDIYKKITADIHRLLAEMK